MAEDEMDKLVGSYLGKKDLPQAESAFHEQGSRPAGSDSRPSNEQGKYFGNHSSLKSWTYSSIGSYNMLTEDSVEGNTEKAPSDSEKNELEGNEKRPADGGKQGTSNKKSKKSVSVVGKNGRSESTVQSVRSETTAQSVASRVKSDLSQPMTVEVEQAMFQDLRRRIQSNSFTLPSVSLYTLSNTNNGLNCSAISNDGSLLAAGFSDSSVKVWDMSKIGEPAAWMSSSQGEQGSSQSEHLSETDRGRRNHLLLRGHSGPVHSTCFSPQGNFILTSSSDSTVRLWNTGSNIAVVCYKGHNYPVWDVQFSPAGHYFACASHDTTASIWSVEKIKPMRVMAGHLSDVDCVQWHVNCNYIATGSSDRTVRLWDVQTGLCARLFIGHRNMVLSLAMSPDGRYLASGDEKGTIMIWELATARCISTITAHSSCIWTLAYSCEGTMLVSGSADCSVKFWDITSCGTPQKIEDRCY